MLGLVAPEELVSEVVDELRDLLALPFVFPLVVVDGVLRAAEERPDALSITSDLLHSTTP